MLLYYIQHQFLDFDANEKVMSPTGWLKARSDNITLAHCMPVPNGYKPQKYFAPQNCKTNLFPYIEHLAVGVYY